MDETTAQNDAAPRRSRLINWIGVLVIVAAGLAFMKWVASQRGLRGDEHHAVGMKLVALEAAPLVGTEKRLTLDDLEGKVTLVNFWKPHCGYCLQELPHLAEMYRSRADRDDFKLVSLIFGGPAETSLNPLREYVEDQLRRQKIEMPVYADPQGTSRKALTIATDWDGGTPATVVLDRHGTIRGVWNGYRPGDEKAMAKLVDQLMAE